MATIEDRHSKNTSNLIKTAKNSKCGTSGGMACHNLSTEVWFRSGSGPVQVELKVQVMVRAERHSSQEESEPLEADLHTDNQENFSCIDPNFMVNKQHLHIKQLEWTEFSLMQHQRHG